MTTPARKTQSSASRVASHRDRMRAAGLRPRTIWVPDTSDPEFAARYRQQARALADVEETAELELWFDASAWPRTQDDIPDYILPDEQ